MIQTFHMDRCHRGPFPEYARVFCRSIQRKVKDFFSFFTCSMSAKWYIWVFTDEQQVLFKLTDTREADMVHQLLANYSGILISDFYAGYDAVPCAQQKCWVHLIRDLNNDLLDAPFDTELQDLVEAVRDLILPIMECVQRYGLQ